MSQNDYVDQSIKENGRRIDYSSKQLKKKLRTEKIEQKKSQKLFGLKAKIFAKKNEDKKNRKEKENIGANKADKQKENNIK